MTTSDGTVTGTFDGAQTPAHRPVSGQYWADVLLALVLTFLGGCIVFQGWRSVDQDPDNNLVMRSATEFLRSGTLPSRGCPNTLGSFNPPGGAWYFLPSLLLFSDYRLFDRTAGILLHLGSLLGVLVLARLAFDRTAAGLALLLYSFSWIALVFATSSAARGHPFFCVWFVVWTVLWQRRKHAKYLAAALVTLAAGLFVHVELAPLILALPAVWYFYRPPLRTKWLLAAALISLLIWFPFLRFQRERGFRDLRSMIFLVDVWPPYLHTYCDRALAREVPQVVTPTSPPDRGLKAAEVFLRHRTRAVLTGLLFPLEQVGETLHAGPLLLVLVLLGLLEYGPGRLFSARLAPDPQRKTVLVAGALIILSAALFVAAYSVGSDRQRERLQCAAILALLPGLYYWCCSARRAAFAGKDCGGRTPRTEAASTEPSGDAAGVLTIALVIPWLVLLFVAGPGNARRFWPLWPLQAIIISGFVAALPARRPAAAWLTGPLGLFLVLVAFVNPLALSRLADWSTNGWQGTDSNFYQALDFLSRNIHHEGSNQASIGYLLPGEDWYAAFQPLDPRSKIGQELDFQFEQRFDIRNTNTCPEAISPRDDYRIALAAPSETNDPEFLLYDRYRLRARLEFREWRRFGDVVVLRRPPNRAFSLQAATSK